MKDDGANARRISEDFSTLVDCFPVACLTMFKRSVHNVATRPLGLFTLNPVF